MTALEVSSVVHSILDAFDNGMNIFTRLVGRKHKRHKKRSKLDRDELKLHDSLSKRPNEIKAEYNQNVVKHGKRFETGDNTAYSTLAHTLLVMNTGLIKLINNALSSDVVDRTKSCQSLLLLSESAAVDTLNALGQLDTRLSLWCPTTPSTNLTSDEAKTSERPANSASPKRPPPSPLLVRGGWVRSKSGSSVVSTASATSTKKRPHQNGNHKRSRSLPVRTIPAVTSNNTNSVPNKVMDDTSKQPDHPPQYEVATSKKQLASANPYQHLLEDTERPQSMLLVPADYFTSQNTSENVIAAPPIPPKVPLHARSNLRSRPRPTSAATFLTTSTKIGEIPERKWISEAVPEEELIERPLPYVIPPPLEPPKRKSRGFRFWRQIT